MVRLLLIVLTIFLVIGLLPAWPYSTNWGYFPSGTVLLIAVIAIAFMASNRRGTIV